MLKIRLQRTGRKNDPSFRVVVTESQNSTKSGKFLEVLGSHNPRAHNPTIKGERVLHWMSKGAQVSPTVHNLLISAGIIEGKKINVLPKKTPIVKEQTEEEKKSAEAPAEAVPVAEAPVADAPVAEEAEAPAEEKAPAPAEEAPAPESKAPTPPTEASEGTESTVSQPNQEDSGETGKEAKTE